MSITYKPVIGHGGDMAVRGVGSVLRGGFNAVFRPQEFVKFQASAYGVTRLGVVRQFVSLLGVYFVNLAAYAVPLSLAGIGVQNSQQPPAQYGAVLARTGLDPTATWQLIVAFFQNSLFISAATGLTLLTFHVSIVLVRDSRGILQSMHTVVYTTSAYLVAVFSGVWYLTNQAGVSGARTLVRNLQAAFVYAVIDALGSNLALPGGRPTELVPTTITTEGQWILALMVLAILYYLVSLYFGARVNHRASRTKSLIAVVGVALAPVVYVAGSVAVFTIGGA
jgi:hypothetical protein